VTDLLFNVAPTDALTFLGAVAHTDLVSTAAC
jgi:hypothetical protein